MTLESAVFQQDQFIYGHKDFHALAVPWSYNQCGYSEEDDMLMTMMTTMTNPTKFLPENDVGQGFSQNLDYSCCTTTPSSMLQSGNEVIVQNARFSPAVGASSTPSAAATAGRRRRRRARSVKSKEEVENQRVTHIAIERNRRKQMNNYLAVLRSMMPPSYVQRGDQASIVGASINFVKELEQLLQSLEARKQVSTNNQQSSNNSLFSDFFVFPQYSTRSSPGDNNNSSETSDQPRSTAEKLSDIADVEVTMVENHANIKVLMKRHRKQLLKIVVGLQFLRLVILHLNVTTVETMVLYSLSVKVGDDSQLTSVTEIAASVYEMVGRIQEEADL